MVAFLLDENVSIRIGDGLSNLDHDVTSLAAEGQSGAADPDVLLLASEWQRVLLTHNRRDFTLLHRAWHAWGEAWNAPRDHSGILILDQPRGMTADAFVRVILDLFDGDREIAGNLWDWRRDRGWLLK